MALPHGTRRRRHLLGRRRLAGAAMLALKLLVRAAMAVPYLNVAAVALRLKIAAIHVETLAVRADNRAALNAPLLVRATVAIPELDATTAAPRLIIRTAHI